jgi:uncharacterized protein (DUF58 family)
MIPQELIRKIRHIEIRTRRLVNDVFAGEYQSVFKGRGMEFAEVREYQPGDEIRTIDWNVTARFGKPFVKRYDEERELTVVLAVDASGSGRFGTAQQMKVEIATELCALLAFSAIANNDKVGLLIFTDQVEKFIPPKKGRQHVLRVIRELLYSKPEGRGTDIGQALSYLNRVVRRRSVVFLVSDFLASGYRRALHVTSRRHDVVAVAISDPRERELPNVGMMLVEDAETGQVQWVDTGSRQFREEYARRGVQDAAEQDELFRSIDVDHIKISTDRSYVDPLVAFFAERARRFHH